MIKHSDMIQQIFTGQPFNCVYLKGNGELTEFINLCKPLAEMPTIRVVTDKRRSARPLQGYLSLIPFQTANHQLRELYTRLIVKFNNEEVIL